MKYVEIGMFEFLRKSRNLKTEGIRGSECIRFVLLSFRRADGDADTHRDRVPWVRPAEMDHHKLSVKTATECARKGVKGTGKVAKFVEVV